MLTTTDIISPAATLAWLLSFAFLAGIIWLVIFLIQKSRKQRQEEEMDQIIDQKVEAKLEEMQAAQNLSADQNADGASQETKGVF